jgi:hypothetical protein
VKARRLIQGANFDPETLSVVFKTFDAAWAEIADHFGELPKDIEGGRLHLARAILTLAHEDSRDVERLKTEALQIMAMAYRGLGRN